MKKIKLSRDYRKQNTEEQNSTGFESNGIMRKPEGTNGASSGNISSIGANTSSEQAPTAFSSIPLHICKKITQKSTLETTYINYICSCIKHLNA